ncbi:MAG: alpha/beta hydrolase [Acidimicrobiia bacterium]|nr:alpha/beta hydrolase [Acidimicrobiia bacterium]
MTIRRRLVSTSGPQINTWLSGGEGIPLLLLHMSPRSGRMYHPVMELLDRPVAAPDRPGFGYSDALTGEPTIERYASATIEVVNDLGWDRFDVVGTHTGSVEAIELAQLAPDRVRRVGLVSIPAYTQQETEIRLEGVAAPRPSPTHDGSHLFEMWRRRAAIRSPEADPTFLHALFVDELLSMEGAHSAYRAVLAYPTLDRLSALQRSIVVFAPHDDLWIQTARAIPHLPAGSTVVELPGLDFDLWSDAPQELADLITVHLSLEQRSKSC